MDILRNSSPLQSKGQTTFTPTLRREIEKAAGSIGSHEDVVELGMRVAKIHPGGERVRTAEGEVTYHHNRLNPWKFWEEPRFAIVLDKVEHCTTEGDRKTTMRYSEKAGLPAARRSSISREGGVPGQPFQTAHVAFGYDGLEGGAPRLENFFARGSEGLEYTHQIRQASNDTLTWDLGESLSVSYLTNSSSLTAAQQVSKDKSEAITQTFQRLLQEVKAPIERATGQESKDGLIKRFTVCLPDRGEAQGQATFRAGQMAELNLNTSETCYNYSVGDRGSWVGSITDKGSQFKQSVSVGWGEAEKVRYEEQVQTLDGKPRQTGLGPRTTRMFWLDDRGGV